LHHRDAARDRGRNERRERTPHREGAIGTQIEFQIPLIKQGNAAFRCRISKPLTAAFSPCYNGVNSYHSKAIKCEQANAIACAAVRKPAAMGYKSKFKSAETDRLFEAILSMKNKEECYRFFEDISTVNELRALSQRFFIAKLLSEGKTYQEIEHLTKASTATISRINKCYRYGADGYKIAIARISE
jgi:TrpR-related protein YerC/YecD